YCQYARRLPLCPLFSLLTHPPPPSSPLFPYTTLFRSPDAPLEAVMSAEVWDQVYRRVADLVEAHRTTLVFVNTRRMAERATRKRSEEHTSELQSLTNLVCRLLLEKKKTNMT